MQSPGPWPKLAVDDWTDTRETLHMWLQIVGKIEMVSTSLVNHWWNVGYEISGRGLRTQLMRGRGAGFDAEFDFVDHRLVFRTSDGRTREVRLEPKSVAAFWQEVVTILDDLELDTQIMASPNEVAAAIPFAEDTEHASYDPDAVTTYWHQLLSAEKVLSAWRAGFIGKDSPVQLFWGSLDLSCVRFSGREAPTYTGSVPSCPEWVMREAESHENAAAGFWSGGGAEGAFYAYAYPEPEGYREADVPGHFDHDLGEWLLPYEEVRTSHDPDATLYRFLEASYAAAADLAQWDRRALEVDRHRLDDHIYHSVDLRHVSWPRA